MEGKWCCVTLCVFLQDVDVVEVAGFLFVEGYELFKCCLCCI